MDRRGGRGVGVSFVEVVAGVDIVEGGAVEVGTAGVAVCFDTRVAVVDGVDTAGTTVAANSAGGIEAVAFAVAVVGRVDGIAPEAASTH